MSDTAPNKSAWIAWLAAAGCLALAAAGWWPRLSASFRGGVLAEPAEVERFALTIPDAARAPWSDFNSPSDQSPPELPGITGEVIWSESRQDGFLTFTGLPSNDPKTEQYQLWIIDSRGPAQRISGGVFSAIPSGGRVVIPIEPSLTIKDAASFAITIEPPGGSAVSDLSRRVVIASFK
jgi:anti-sigma-K factor RskA